MKTLSSMILALLFISALAVTGLAGDQKAKPNGGQSNYKPDKPDPKEPQDPDDGYQYIPLECKASFQTRQKPAQLGQPSIWTFHGEVVNKTGQVIPKGARIEFSFSPGNIPGYFKTVQSSYLLLPVALPVNNDWFLGSAVFVTTHEPVNMSCKAFYRKKK
jgi:hypothetical protein